MTDLGIHQSHDLVDNVAAVSRKHKKPIVLSKAPARSPASHPPYHTMLKSGILALKDNKGSSRAALLKYIVSHYKINDKITVVNARLRLALKRGVVHGLLKQVKGTGASGSFKLSEKPVSTTVSVKARKPKTLKSDSKVRKPQAKKVVKGTVAKPQKTVTKAKAKKVIKAKKTKAAVSPKKPLIVKKKPSNLASHHVSKKKSQK